MFINQVYCVFSSNNSCLNFINFFILPLDLLYWVGFYLHDLNIAFNYFQSFCFIIKACQAIYFKFSSVYYTMTLWL